ncbi:MAG: UDP-N-acetylmuramate dehydrogenase [Bacteroidota bacterium]
MDIYKNHSLKDYNTFGINVRASLFAKVYSMDELRMLLLGYKNKRKLVLGGGSNVLLTKDIDHLVIFNSIKGFELVREYDNESIVKVGSGENWHEFVLKCLKYNLGGVENLSLIPGTVGAAPIQNIGAYGVELKDVFERLEAVELATGKRYIFDRAACKFAYRDSIFKGDLKGKFFITSVYFKLSKQHDINISYGAIHEVLKAKGRTASEISIQDVSEAVIAIRQKKLPDPKVLGNSGSFFKNPEITLAQFQELHQQFPEIVHYPLPTGKIKIPAGWLIEQCGWKGKRVGNTGAYKKQALVLVNYGGASGQEVYQLAQKIAASVEEKFGIQIVPEVNVI